MNLFDLHSEIKPALNLASAAVTGTSAGIIVDTASFNGLEFVALVAAVTANVTVLVEHGDESDLSDSTTVPADEILGASTVLIADANTSKSFGYVGKRRYVRVTLGGGTSNGVVGLTSILYAPYHSPAQE